MAKQIEVKEETSIKHPQQEKAEMDIVLAIKHLLALEDHLYEYQPEDENEYVWRDNMLHGVQGLRDDLFDMFEEKDKRYHCMAKHLMGAAMATEEITKTYSQNPHQPQYEDMTLISDMVHTQLISVLEKLLGHDIENCRRCK